MKQTIAQFLSIKEFPFIIKDKYGNKIYYEDSDGYWSKKEYNETGNKVYFENNSDGIWSNYNTNRNSVNNKVVKIEGKKYQLKEVK